MKLIATNRIRIADVREGFTLIELLVVITIIGILAFGLLTVINPLEQFAKARDTEKKNDLTQIKKALELYYQDNGSYPQSLGGKIVNAAGQAVEWGTSGFTPYLATMPKDPVSEKSYVYLSIDDGQTYYLFASLERGGRDPQACNAPENTACTKATANNLSCGTGICNFGVSSSNDSPN